MNCYEQCREWLEKHPKATITEIWMGGYWTSTDNWCKKER